LRAKRYTFSVGPLLSPRPIVAGRDGWECGGGGTVADCEEEMAAVAEQDAGGVEEGSDVLGHGRGFAGLILGRIRADLSWALPPAQKPSGFPGTLVAWITAPFGRWPSIVFWSTCHIV
jgi:hypothetical protein